MNDRMTDQDKILAFIQSTGPTLPAKVAKQIGTDILIASAHLADLTSQRKVRISNLKVGGSPLYFLDGQQDKLYAFVEGNTNPKNIDVLDRLREEKVLQEKNLDLLAKVALRSLKDFAVPLQVRTQSGVELFWKWHLLPKEETNISIGLILKPKEEPVKEIEPVKEEPIPEEIIEKVIEKVVEEPTPEEKIENTESDDSDSLAKPVETKKEEVSTEEEPEEITPEDVAEENNEDIKSKEPKKEEVPTKEEPKPVKKKQTKPVRKKKKVQTKLIKKEEPEPEPEPEPEQEVEEEKKPRRKVTEDFLPIIENFLKTLEISIEVKETVRKNAEMDFILTVPSAVGKMKYYCKAKNKKRCDEKDISAAYMEAQIKKLPLLFLYSNEISKKAQEMLESDAFENAMVRRIE
jgi:hypothetical protein